MHISSSFLYVPCNPRALPSFPTRRSSDLRVPPDSGGFPGCLATPPEKSWRAQAPSRTSSARFHSQTRIRRANHPQRDRKSTRLNSSHVAISYAVFCLKKKKRHTSKECTQH